MKKKQKLEKLNAKMFVGYQMLFLQQIIKNPI